MATLKSDIINTLKPVRPRATDRAKIIKVIVTESIVGYGIEEDIVRAVYRYWSLDGKLLAEYDPMRENIDPSSTVTPSFYSPRELLEDA